MSSARSQPARSRRSASQRLARWPGRRNRHSVVGVRRCGSGLTAHLSLSGGPALRRRVSRIHALTLPAAAISSRSAELPQGWCRRATDPLRRSRGRRRVLFAYVTPNLRMAAPRCRSTVRGDRKSYVGDLPVGDALGDQLERPRARAATAGRRTRGDRLARPGPRRRRSWRSSWRDAVGVPAGTRSLSPAGRSTSVFVASSVRPAASRQRPSRSRVELLLVGPRELSPGRGRLRIVSGRCLGIAGGFGDEAAADSGAAPPAVPVLAGHRGRRRTSTTRSAARFAGVDPGPRCAPARSMHPTATSASPRSVEHRGLADRQGFAGLVVQQEQPAQSAAAGGEHAIDDPAPGQLGDHGTQLSLAPAGVRRRRAGAAPGVARLQPRLGQGVLGIDAGVDPLGQVRAIGRCASRGTPWSARPS